MDLKSLVSMFSASAVGVLLLIVNATAQDFQRGPARSPHGPLSKPCGACHTSTSWNSLRSMPDFSHDRETNFALTGLHGNVQCRLCHSRLVFANVGKKCADCHADIHQRRLGVRCEQCHTVKGWRVAVQAIQTHQNRFPLLGAHAAAECAACHPGAASARFTGLSTACASCHLKDYRQARTFNHQAANVPMTCEQCHGVDKWHTTKLDHAQVAKFALDGAHARVECSACHTGGRFGGTLKDCFSCHSRQFTAGGDVDHVKAGFPRDCASCHTTVSWRGGLFNHAGTTKFALTGAHVQTACAQCHQGGRFAGTRAECYECHVKDFEAAKSPDHVNGRLATDCQGCHTTGSWQGAQFDHNKARFALTGAHVQTACAQCHVGGKYAGTSAQCADCHLAVYQKTTNPNHAAAGFPQDCTVCHTTARWQGATFDHNKARFALTGAHVQTACAQCHVGGKYAGTSAQCADCHLAAFEKTTNPNHAAAGFPQDCTACHTTARWQGGQFDHSKARFALTGAHVQTACAQCHVGGKYTGTSAQCAGCHLAAYQKTTNPNHAAAGFPQDCTACHTTTRWQGATFDHNKARFALTGAHVQTACAQCHVGGKYTGTSAQCAGCHLPAYQKTTNPNHAAAGFPQDCTACHTTARWQGAQFDHNKARFTLTGAHVQTACAQCHVGGKYTGTSGPVRGLPPAGLPENHQPEPRRRGIPAGLHRVPHHHALAGGQFDHNKARFALTGAHVQTACAQCHVGGIYTGTSAQCAGCHLPAYQKTTNPNHAAAGFPQDCTACHTTARWQGATFDHNKARFALTGAHVQTACAQCHVGGKYTGTSAQCAGCHLPAYQKTTNPNHAAAGFPQDCTACHTTARWQGASSTTTRRASRSPGRTCRPPARSATWAANTRGRPPSARAATCRPTRKPPTRTTPPRDSRRTAPHATPPRAGRGPSSTTTRRASRSPGRTCRPPARSATWAANTRERPPSARAATCRPTRKPPTRTTPPRDSRRTAPHATPRRAGRGPSSTTTRRASRSPGRTCRPPARSATWAANTRARRPSARAATWRPTRKPPTRTTPPRDSRRTAPHAIRPRAGRGPSSTTTRRASRSPGRTCRPPARSATWAANTPAPPPSARAATCRPTRKPPTRTTSPRDSRRTAPHAIPRRAGRGPHSTTTRRASRSPGRTCRPPARSATWAANTRARSAQCAGCHLAAYQKTTNPNHAAAGIPAGLHRMPYHRALAGGPVRPQQGALHAHRGARADRLRAVPRGRQIHGHLGPVRGLPPGGLPEDHQPEPRRRRVPAGLHRMPYDHALAGGHVRPQQGALRAHRGARADRLRAVPRGRQIHGNLRPVRGLPPGGLPEDHQPEPRRRGIPAGLHRMPHHHALAGGPVRPQQGALRAHRGARADRLRAVPRGRQIHGNARPSARAATCRPTRRPPTRTTPPRDSRRTAPRAIPPRAGRGPRSTTARRASRSPGRTCRPPARSATWAANTRERPAQCAGCHLPAYQKTTNPNHAAAGFPQDCTACHTTTRWQGAQFDHNKARFALTGAHVQTACALCHVGGKYTGTSAQCAGCHLPAYQKTTNPNHVASGFPQDCTACHTTTRWQGATFDHSKARFALTGAHVQTACAQCHVGGKYTGTLRPVRGLPPAGLPENHQPEPRRRRDSRRTAPPATPPPAGREPRSTTARRASRSPGRTCRPPAHCATWAANTPAPRPSARAATCRPTRKPPTRTTPPRGSRRIALLAIPPRNGRERYSITTPEPATRWPEPMCKSPVHCATSTDGMPAPPPSARAAT